MPRRDETAQGITQRERAARDVWIGSRGTPMDRSGNTEAIPSVTPRRLDISGAVSIDLAGAAVANLHLRLTGNVTSFELLNPADGGVYNVRFIQDATGSRTFAPFASAYDFTGGTAPTFTTTANGYDFMCAQWGATEAKFACSFLPGMA